MAKTSFARPHPAGSNAEGARRVDGHRAEPRLPHERDESADNQAGPVSPVIEQARRDVERGLKDTDRGPVMDEVYHRTLRGR